MSGALDSAKKLINAKTVRDVMEAGLPQKVDSIPDIEAFNSFANGPDGEWEKFDADEKINADGSLTTSDHLPNDPPNEQTRTAFDGVKRIITAHEVELAGNFISGTARLNTRANARFTNLPGNIHTDIIDMDGPFRPLRARNYVASTQQSTLIVPDEAALEIVRQFPFSEILDAKLDDPQDLKRIHRAYHEFSAVNFDEDVFGDWDNLNKIDPQTVKDMLEMHKRLQACLEPSEDGTINLMSNISFHARQLPFSEGRVFYQAIGYDRAEAKKDYGLDM